MNAQQLSARRALVLDDDGQTGYVTGFDAYPAGTYLRVSQEPREGAADFDPKTERWVNAEKVTVL